MSDEARIIALTAEAQAAVAERDRLRVENEALRKGQVVARHHIAMALRALNGDTDETTRRHEHG